MTDTTELAVDFSASAIKGIYNFGTSFKPRPIIALPFLSSTTPEMVKDSSFTNPNFGGYIGFSDSYYLYGNLAKNSISRLPLKKPKFELALYKTLILVGLIGTIHNLEPGTKFNLAFTLPAKEYADRKTLEKSLDQALEQFNFCGDKMSFKLNNFLCLPEGAPTFLQVQTPSTQNQAQVVLMLGLRDISLLFFENNQISRSFSEALGFSRFYEIFKEQSSCQQDLLTLAQILSGRELHLLCGNLDKRYRRDKLKETKSAIAVAKKQYLLILKQLLEAEIDSDTRLIIVTGGTAFYLRRELKTLLKQLFSCDITFCEQLEEQVVDRFGSSFIQQNSLEYRFSEVYGLFMYNHAQNIWGGKN